MKTKFFYFAAAAMMLAACSNDESVNEVQDTDFISLTAVVQNNVTRASLTDAEAQNTQFEQGQSIYVEAYKHGVNTTYATGTYTTIDGAGTLSGSIKYPYTDGVVGNVDIIAYYPTTNESNNVTSALTTFTVSSSQTSKDNYQNSDLMYAKAGTEGDGLAKGNTHELTFNHALTKIIVNLTADESINDNGLTKLTAVKINNTYLTANILQGVCQSAKTDDETATDIDIFGTTKTSHQGIIVPQTITKGTVFITITYNEQELTYSIPDGGSDVDKQFVKGNVYTYSFTLSATGITLQSSSITNWANGSTGGTGDPDTRHKVEETITL